MSRKGSQRVVYVQYTNPAVLPPLDQSAKIFTAHNWEIIFLGRHLKGDPDAFRLDEAVASSVELMGYWGGGPLLKLNYLWFIVWCCWRVLMIKPTLLYVSDPISSPVGIVLAFTTSVPVIYHEHDSPFEIPRSRVERLLIRARRVLARKSRLCILPNESRLEAFLADLPAGTPILRVMNCPSTNEIRHSVGRRFPGGELKIYYHGSIVPDRVPLQLLDALALVADGVSLSVAGYETTGHAGYIDYFTQQARLRGLESRIRFLGPVKTRDELFKFCSEHHVGLALLPKQTADPNLRAMAGASNKVFDYLACGLPVLVSDLRDERRLFVNAGVARCCDPEDPKSIASEFQWFLNHPLQASEMGERGRLKIISEWNYEKQFQPVLDVVLCKWGLTEPNARP